MPPRISLVLGMVALVMVQIIDARRPRVRLPMPTSETIPYVAEVMGATTYEESIEEGGEVKRVQRKLSGPEHKEPDLDREEEFTEYQGVIGRPGVDFPVLPGIPRTDFSCRSVKNSGYYADLDTGCQVFHICDGGRKISFLCPNGTIFRQSHLICDWWFRVDCERSVELYEESAEQLAHDQMVYKKRAQEITKAINEKPTTEVPRAASSNQQRQYRRKQRPQQEEQERQIPAETASFASNRHRFANHLENQYRQYTASTTSTTTVFPYTTQKDLYNYNAQPYPTTQKTPLNYNPPNFQEVHNRGEHYQITQKPTTNYNPPNLKKVQSGDQHSQLTPKITPSNNPPNFQEVHKNEQNYQTTPKIIPNYNPPNFQAVHNSEGIYQTPPKNTPTYNPPNFQELHKKEQNYQTTPKITPSYNPPNFQAIPNSEGSYQIIPKNASTYNPTNFQELHNNEQNYQTTPKITPSYNPLHFQAIPNSERSYQTTPKIIPSYKPSNYEEMQTNEKHNNKQYNREESNNEETINNSYPGSVYSSYNYTYQNAHFYNNHSNYSSHYNYSSKDYDTHSLANGQYIEQEDKNEKNNYFDYTQSKPKNSFELKSSYDSVVPLGSTTAKSLISSESNLFNDQTQRQDQQILSSTRSPLKQKTIFDVKIKPTKDFAYVELLRHEENLKNYPKTTSASPTYSSTSPSHQTSRDTSLSLSHDVIPVSHFATTPSPSSVESSTRATYLPTKATETTKQADQSTTKPAVNRYASIHVSGTSEEIRPEIVNSLMESGVTPTSAKALHSLASYISSAAADELGSIYSQQNGHPHVSDVILKFHSGTSVTNEYPQNEVTTNIPISSPEESLPAVLTKATKESYSYLFSESKEQTENKKEEPNPFLEIDYTTQKPKTTNRQTTRVSDRDLRLRDSSELRELAQVFSRALSAYLEDPETFKEILAQVRPTEPSNVEQTTPSPEDEVLDFSDANQERRGSTNAPITTLGSKGFADDNVNIGDINNLANAGQTFEPDNSLDHNTFPPTAPEDYESSHFNTVTPRLTVNSISNNSNSLDYFTRLGLKEDQSYFPTVGGVGDTSRPRYGGFQNNTQKNMRTYSPYGADVPKNLTGTPISITTPVPQTEVPLLFADVNTSSTIPKELPEPNDVNSLVKINALNSDHSSSEEITENSSYQTSPSAYQEDTYYPTGDQEKGLITSGSQSLVSSNYLQFAKRFNEQSQKDGSKYYSALYSPNSYVNYAPSAVQHQKDIKEDYKSEEFIPYFGQEPPFENLAKPSGFQTTKVLDDIKQGPEQNTKNDSYTKPLPLNIFADPINYHIGTINDELSTPSYHDKNSEYKVAYKNVNLGNGVRLEKHGSSTESRNHEASWTISPLIDLTTGGGSTLSFNYSHSPVSSSSAHYLSTQQFEATTFRPQRSSETLETQDYQWGNGLTESDLEEAVTTTTLNDFTETVKPNEESISFEKTAMNMFGNLNESAAVTLMDMMAKAEKNMTIRRLVLLLVNEKGRENRTVQESRENLINALLSNMEETTTPTILASPSTPQTVQIPRKKVRVSRVRISTTSTTAEPPKRSAKFYRGTDTQTAVHGSSKDPSEINKINSAKLYIPSPTSSAYTNTLPIDSDARAVELLRTLYSLAAKWG